MTGTYTRTAGPAAEPVTLAELKSHARVDSSDEDALLTMLITAAREAVSSETGRALVTETWTLALDAWPGEGRDDWWDGVREAPIAVLDAAEVRILKAPFLAISKVETFDEAGAATEWASSNWYGTPDLGTGRLVRKRGATWPVPGRDRAGILITFTAGYGGSASAVPFPLRQAVLMLAAHWYENRMPASDCTAGSEMPFGVSRLLAPYRVLR